MMRSLISRDLQHIWHPCAQMKDLHDFPPLMVESASGSYMELIDGHRLIDAISSWWCKSLGHGHPRLKQALKTQLEKFEHVMFGNTSYEMIIELSEKLAALTPMLDKVFYASEGSCAVEIALKMSVHVRQLQGQSQRQQFLALQNGYHGETIGALSVSDLGIYKHPYESHCWPVKFIENIPYVSGVEDPLWKNCDTYWPIIEQQLERHVQQTTAIILEPIVQGAAGMKIYSQDFLKKLRMWTKENDIYLIADEIMTGFGRTGSMLACQYADIEPDFMCLSKGLTSGMLPLSVVLTSAKIYEMFYDDYETQKAFLHSHTYSGNALAASVALECLRVMKEENIVQHVQQQAPYLRLLMQEVSDSSKKLKNIRSIGAIVAADLIVGSNISRAGFKIGQAAMKHGALLRPIGNTLYWVPPLNISKNTLLELQKITHDAIIEVLHD